MSPVAVRTRNRSNVRVRRDDAPAQRFDETRAADVVERDAGRSHVRDEDAVVVVESSGGRPAACAITIAVPRGIVIVMSPLPRAMIASCCAPGSSGSTKDSAGSVTGPWSVIDLVATRI